MCVQKYGFTAFEDGPGDHRALYLNIPANQILAEDKSVIKRQEVRRLNSKNPSVVKKINELFDHQLDRNHIEDRTFQMQRMIKFPAPTYLATKYDKTEKFQNESFIFVH